MPESCVYDLEDYENIINEGFECNLTKEAMDTISGLAEQVGAPTYVKTPVFEKRENVYKKRRGVNQNVTDGEWECLRSFKATEINKKEGVDKSIDDIRGILNKMSLENYDSMKQEAFKLIDEIMADTSSADNMQRIGVTVFDMASSNKFYSELYATFYRHLMERHEVFSTIYKQNFDQFLALFDNINYVDPNVDYDAYCNVNKENEQRKSLSMFFVNLMKQSIISHYDMIIIIEKLQGKINEFIGMEDSVSKAEEVTENLFIIIDRIKTELKDNAAWVNIYNKIQTVAEYGVKERPSLSNKIIFKHMDLIDLLE